MNFYIAQGISVLTGIFAIVMMQFKDMKKILLFQIIINFTASLNYLLLGGNSGAIVSLLAILQSVVMFIYNTKKRKPHAAVVIGFILSYVICSAYNIILSGDPMEILPALAAICFSISLVQEKASAFRIWGVLNPTCWFIYDLYVASYVMFVVHAAIAVSAIVGIVRLDLKGREKRSR